MVIALRDKLRSSGFTRIGVIDYSGTPSWRKALEFDEAVTMPETHLSRWRDFGAKLHTYSRVFVIGADCLDGFYSAALSRRLLEVGMFATYCGCQATICGSSFNQSPASPVVSTLANLPRKLRLLARDPVSFSRLKSLSSVEPELVADLAFMLIPDQELIPATKKWIARQRAENKNILGVNMCHAFLSKTQKTEIPRLVTRFTEALENRLGAVSDLAVILIPHDTRGEQSDLALCQQTCRNLSGKFSDRLFLFDESADPRALKAVAKLLDACATCRMHFGIACLGAGTPIGVIPYQDKFEGLFKHFNISPPCLSPDLFFNAGMLENFLTDTISDAKAQAKLIRERATHVQTLAQKNLGI